MVCDPVEELPRNLHLFDASVSHGVFAVIPLRVFFNAVSSVRLHMLGSNTSGKLFAERSSAC